MIIPYCQITATSDERTNSLIVRAPENIQTQIQKILEVIDNPKNTKTLTIIKIKNIPANDLAIIIQNLITFKFKELAGVCVGENKTNKIILLEEPKNSIEISDIINKIDTNPKYNSNSFIMKLKNSKADKIANIINSIR
jgi:hypothetical protein